MPASVISISGRRPGAYVLLEAALPERPVRNIGVLLLDPATDRGWLKMREGYDDIAAEEDAEVFAALEEDVRAQIAESGAEAFLRSLEDSLSNVLRITDRQSVEVDSFTRVLRNSTAITWRQWTCIVSARTCLSIRCARPRGDWGKRCLWTPRIGYRRRRA